MDNPGDNLHVSYTGYDRNFTMTCPETKICPLTMGSIADDALTLLEERTPMAPHVRQLRDRYHDLVCTSREMDALQPAAPARSRSSSELADGEVRCECGTWSGVRCAWFGTVEETVEVEFTPEPKRCTPPSAECALRIRVEQSCAKVMLELDSEWVRVLTPSVAGIHTPDTRRHTSGGS